MTGSAGGIVHNPVLDSVRGWAILLVLMVHCLAFESGDSRALAVLNEFARAGWLGVDLFFVLSGYLITSILLSTRQQHGYFVNFYARRALRIFPAYYLYLIIAFALLPYVVHGVSGETLRAWAISSALYLQNIHMMLVGSSSPWRGLDHLWSLAIEEHFYLFWPVIIALLPPRRLAHACLVLIGVAWLVKAGLLLVHQWPMAGYVFMPARMDALAAGGLIACLAQTPRRQYSAMAVMLGGGALAALVGLAVIKGGLRLSGGLNIALITSGAAVLFASALYLVVTCDFRPWWLHNPLLTTLGRYSYGMYLFHIAVIELFQVPLLGGLKTTLGYNLASLASGFATILVTLGLAALSYHLFEVRFLKLKRYFTARGGV